MIRRFAILSALWVAAACTTNGGTAVPATTPASSDAAVAPTITPALVGPPVRVL